MSGYHRKGTKFPSYYATAVKTALPALEYVGKKAFSYYNKKRKMKQSYQRAVKRFRKNNRPRSSSVRVDGVSGGQYRMATRKRRRRRAKSLKQQISQVRRLIPKKSTKLFREFQTVCLPGVSNQRRAYDLNCFSTTEYDAWASDLTLVDSDGVADYTAENTSLSYALFYKLMLKNNRTANVHIQYAFFVCKDDDNEAPIECIREELNDRGYSISAVSGETASTATSSYIPGRLQLNGGTNYHAPMFGGGALQRNWRMQGKVKSAIIGPGDTFDCVISRKLTYKPEIKDQEPGFNYYSNYDTRLVILLGGDLGHDDTNTTLVGRCAYQLDCEEQKQCLVTYSNPKALRQVDYSDNLTNTNFTTPVHADNHASKIETDEV